MSTNLYVGNLPYSINEEELRSIFSQYGTVASVKIITDKVTGRAKGFAFVEMTTADDAQAASKGLDSSNLGGRNIKVDVARPREPRQEKRNYY